MNLCEIFLSGFIFENVFVWSAIGLSIIILFSYTLSESFWVGLRVIFFIFIQTLIMLLLRPFFDFPGKELFLILALISTELLVSIAVDFLLPYSCLGSSIVDFVQRGDAIVPLYLSLIMAKRYDVAQSILYGLGLSVGFMSLLVVMTAVSIKFSFHRLDDYHRCALKLFILGILSLINF